MPMANSTWSFDHVRRLTHSAGGPEAFQSLAAFDQARMDELAEAVLDNPPQPDANVPAHEIWPVVNARSSAMSLPDGSLVSVAEPVGPNLMAAMNPREVGKNVFSTGVIQALLYSHGLVIEDPLSMASELYLTAPAETRRYARRYIEAAALSLIEIEELLDAGVVETYFTPSARRRTGSKTAATLMSRLENGSSLTIDEVWDSFEAAYVEGLGPELRELWRYIRAGNRYPSHDLLEAAIRNSGPELASIFVEVVSQLRPSAVVSNVVHTLATEIDDVANLGGRHDIYCASDLSARLLFLQTTDPVAAVRVHQLARTEVPNLSSLAIKDVVKIRQQSEAFETWRARLSQGLEYAHRLKKELGDDVDVSASVDELLMEARHSMAEESKRTRSILSDGFVGFTAGALGGAISGITSGLAGGLLGAAGGALPAVSQHVLNVSKRTPEHVRRHYVVFSRDKRH